MQAPQRELYFVAASCVSIQVCTVWMLTQDGMPRSADLNLLQCTCCHCMHTMHTSMAYYETLIVGLV